MSGSRFATTLARPGKASFRVTVHVVVRIGCTAPCVPASRGALTYQTGEQRRYVGWRGTARRERVICPRANIEAVAFGVEPPQYPQHNGSCMPEQEMRNDGCAAARSAYCLGLGSQRARR